MDRRFGNYHVYDCRITHLRGQRPAGVCRRSQRSHARQGTSAHRHHSQMDMEHLYRPYSDSRSPVNAGRHELVRQCVPRLRHHRNGWFLHQAGKRSLLQLSLYRICHLYLHVHSGINFTLLLLFVNRKFKKVIDNAELKWYFWSVAGFTAIIAVVLYYTSPMGAEEAFRKSLFQVISLHTSTGFATDDYMLWTPVLWGLLTIVMVIGACAGSTTGSTALG